MAKSAVTWGVAKAFSYRTLCPIHLIIIGRVCTGNLIKSYTICQEMLQSAGTLLPLPAPTLPYVTSMKVIWAL